MLEILQNIKDDIARLDRKAITALIYAAFGLSSIYYLKGASVPAVLFRGTPFEDIGLLIAESTSNNLLALSWWVLVVTVFYIGLPMLIIKISWRERLSDFGLSFKLEPDFLKVFAVAVAVMLPLVYLMSRTEGFTLKYPFLRIYNGEAYMGSTLLIWELLYFVQFFGLEFFFRGFLVHSLKPAFGLYSIFIMTVPYCMIHFGKPPAETMSAIVAGVFLGWLSYRNGNIWLGLALHCAVALSMDIFALHAKGLLI